MSLISINNLIFHLSNKKVFILVSHDSDFLDKWKLKVANNIKISYVPQSIEELNENLKSFARNNKTFI